MPVFAIQYLEDSPELPSLTPSEAAGKLALSYQHLPFQILILGWHLPDPLRDACVNEARRLGIEIYRWHPLLTSDGVFFPKPEWRTVGLLGAPISGFRDLPEFTFFCPNRLEARHAALERLEDILRSGIYDGIFLDRIRYPSALSNPLRDLACFCSGCQQLAATEVVDLEEVRRRILPFFNTPQSLRIFLNLLFDRQGETIPLSAVPRAIESHVLQTLMLFLSFRKRSINRMVAEVSALIRSHGLNVGLDCFSPILAPTVGQSLIRLDTFADWVKTMNYIHAWGPASLPYELSNLAAWLVDRNAWSESETLEFLTILTGLPLPPALSDFQKVGFSAPVLVEEIRRGRRQGIRQLLTGVELVEIPGVAELSQAQIFSDLSSAYQAGADGLVLSWDLRHIPLERLPLVAQTWLSR